MDKKPKIIKNENYDKIKNVVCPFCGFTGDKDEFLVEYYETILYDVSCPKCDKMIYVVPFDVDYDRSNTTDEQANKQAKEQTKKHAKDYKKSHFKDEEHLRMVWWLHESE